MPSGTSNMILRILTSRAIQPFSVDRGCTDVVHHCRPSRSCMLHSVGRVSHVVINSTLVHIVHVRSVRHVLSRSRKQLRKLHCTALCKRDDYQQRQSVARTHVASLPVIHVKRPSCEQTNVIQEGFKMVKGHMR